MEKVNAELFSMAFSLMAIAMEERPDTRCTRQDAAFILIDYVKYQGEQAVIDLYGFLCWCRTTGHSEGYAWANIGHDLNGMRDKFMSPRTTGYGKFCEQSIES